MRRSLGTLMSTLGVSALLLSVGAAVPQHAGNSELLYLGTQDGVSVVDSSTGDATFSARDALPTGDWSLVVQARAVKKHRTAVEVGGAIRSVADTLAYTAKGSVQCAC